MSGAITAESNPHKELFTQQAFALAPTLLLVAFI